MCTKNVERRIVRSIIDINDLATWQRSRNRFHHRADGAAFVKDGDEDGEERGHTDRIVAQIFDRLSRDLTSDMSPDLESRPIAAQKKNHLIL